MKIVLPLILLLLVAALVATAAESPHLSAGPGTPPSVTVLAAEVHAVTAERDALRAENAVLRKQVAEMSVMLENLIRIQQRDVGLRTPSAKLP